MSEVENTETQPTARKAASPVEVNDEGKFAANNIEGQYRIAQIFHKSGLVPKAFDSAEKVLVGMQFARELGLEPLSGLRNIAVVNGQPSIWGELPLKLAYQTRQLEHIEEFVIDKDYNKICLENKNLTAEPWAGVCRLKRNALPMVEATFTLDEAKRAGLLDKKSPWQTYTKIMLMRRARSQALKIAFPDAIGGAPIAEYDFNYTPTSDEARDVTRQGVEIVSGADKINQLLREPADN
jgi:hypothetical protein